MQPRHVSFEKISAYNVGANKGYKAVEFIGTWTQRRHVNAQAWYRAMMDFAFAKSEIGARVHFSFPRCRPPGPPYFHVHFGFNATM